MQQSISALQIQKGIEQPESLNPQILNGKLQLKRKQRTLQEYVDGILSGDRVMLSLAITLIESLNPAHQALAQQIIEKCLPAANQSIRIGITGTPGVGKSTFIESFGLEIIANGHKVAVLAIDPSSQLSRGSILGDKTRMLQLSQHQDAFIRPSAAGSSLGGVARKTRETIILCEAAGYDTIIIETVGVGQSEIAVHSMVDFFLLLLLPGAGDELQGIKRGIVEMADLIAVNKADEERLTLAKQAKGAYQNALKLFPPKESRWQPQAMICSALSKMGIAEIWKYITDYQIFIKNNGFFDRQRMEQSTYWLRETINEALIRNFYEQPFIQAQLLDLEQALHQGAITSFQAAEQLLSAFKTSNASHSSY
jgi:LAO/AO transport system kinase